jgi:hypothetical protein
MTSCNSRTNVATRMVEALGMFISGSQGKGEVIRGTMPLKRQSLGARPQRSNYSVEERGRLSLRG